MRILITKKLCMIILLCMILILIRIYYISTGWFASNNDHIGKNKTVENPSELFTEQLTNIKTILERLNEKDIYCKEVPPNLKGQVNVVDMPSTYFNAISNETYFSNVTTNTSFEWMSAFDSVHLGGIWQPKHCRARHRLAVIIPYRDRYNNLRSFLYHMHPILQRQEIAYQMFVVEQIGQGIFNKGVLMNTGFLHALKMVNYSTPKSMSDKTKQTNETASSDRFPFDCVVFHDVDLLPEDDRIMYSCPSKRPRHLSVGIDKFNYKMPYYELIGGVLIFRTSHFISVNGYSNEYWGWGAEDDDMERVRYERPAWTLARYKMLKHSNRVINPVRGDLLKSAANRLHVDGLSSVKLNIVAVNRFRLFTQILVNVGEPPPPQTPASSQPSVMLSTQDKTFLANIIANITHIRNLTVNELNSLKNILVALNKPK